MFLFLKRDRPFSEAIASWIMPAIAPKTKNAIALLIYLSNAIAPVVHNKAIASDRESAIAPFPSRKAIAFYDQL